MPSTLTVTSATDGGPGSLRATVSRAAAGDVIRFAPALRGARLDLTLGELEINKSLNIRGSGQTLDAGGNSHVIAIDGPNTTASLSGLTITGGLASLASVPGPAYAGGGIYVDDASLSIRDSVISDNQAVGSPGGGIRPAAIPAEGGGLFAYDSHVNLINTSVIGNQALGGQNSLTEQTGSASGGGLALIKSEAAISGGSLQANLAQGGDAVNPLKGFPYSNGGAADGGGILLLASNLDLVGVDVSDNRALGGIGLAGSLAPRVHCKARHGRRRRRRRDLYREGRAGEQDRHTVHQEFLPEQQPGPGRSRRQGRERSIGGARRTGAGRSDRATGGHDAHTELHTDSRQRGAGGVAAANAAGAGADTSSGGESFGGAIDSRYFTRISADAVTFQGNVAQGERGGDSGPIAEPRRAWGARPRGARGISRTPAGPNINHSRHLTSFSAT